jgi:hypothetical protein
MVLAMFFRHSRVLTGLGHDTEDINFDLKSIHSAAKLSYSTPEICRPWPGSYHVDVGVVSKLVTTI